MATGADVADDLPLSFVERAVRWALEEQDVRDAVLSVALVSDGEIAELNDRYLSHSGPTDVISFPLSVDETRVVGDIYIGVQQAARQANEMNVPIDEELARLAIHGTLHVLGYDHPATEDREHSGMYRRQEALLADFLASTAGSR